MQIPIVEQLTADPPAPLREAAERLAETLLREHPELAAGEFRDLVPATLDDGGALNLDDLSEISQLDPGDDVRFYQDRARLRADDGDLVASCGDAIDGHEAYCRDFLGLGSPQWLRPEPPRNGMRIAEACWEDADVRRSLIEKLPSRELSYVHPHMGTFAVWELAALLHEETGRPLKVVAPPPRLSRWANNKVAFAETVRRLFGAEFVPRTESAWNTAILAKRVQWLAAEADAIGLKLPDAAGGGGNVVLSAARLRGKPLAEIEQLLKRAVSVLDWRGERELLVDVWEADVLCSPSVQWWIPPERDGAPVVEGIFVQIMEGDEGMFVGTMPAQFPAGVSQEIADRCWLLARLFQRLGYVGRCSFDLILIGDDLRNCRMEFIECNARWGGTSLPMTLMNRIFGDWKTQPFAVQVFHHIDGLNTVSFADVLDVFRRDLFDVRTRTGSLIFYNPGRLRHQSGISSILLGSSWEQAAGEVRREFSHRLVKLARNVK
ncbi:MAG: hypothetical protein ACE5KM_11535 [Planctomycetaceae bacterium]